MGQLDQIKLIQTQLNNITTTANAHTTEISELKTQLKEKDYAVDKISCRIDQMQVQTDHMEYEIRKINLNIVGVVEEADETAESLKTHLESWLSSLTRKTISIDTAVRIGLKKRNKPRTIRIKFTNINDRSAVYNARFDTVHPIYINEDLPTSMFKTLMLLKEKVKSLKSQGIAGAKINLFKMSVQTSDKVYTLNRNNEFEECLAPAETNQDANHDNAMETTSNPL